MKTSLRILHIEDSPNDAELVKETLKGAGIVCDKYVVVETRANFITALEESGWDLILCDYLLPSFDGISALAIAKEKYPEVPFICVSGIIGEETAIEALKKGATDYVLKDRLSKLVPAVHRALKEVQERNERKRLEEQLFQAQKMEAIGRLAGGIAHDFNNMLTVIKGNTELLKENLLPQSQEMELLEEILEASNKSADLSRQLLTFSRREPIKPRVLQINEVLLNLEKILRRVIGEDIELIVTPGKDVSLLKGDAGQIEQVLLNLAVNAKDAMPKGGKLTIETKNTQLDEEYAKGHLEVKPGDYVLISVTDSGVGMSEEVKKHLFEPFFTTKEIGKGTGLGLSVVYGIIKQHQGHISVYSELGKGTTFHIYFPRLEEEGKGTTSPKSKPAPLPKGKKTILIVEDDSSVRKFASKTLEKLGYRVLEVSKPEETIKVLKENEDLKVDLLLTDIVMPKMSGKELAEKIRNLYPDLRVIFMSGYTKNHPEFQNLLGKDFDFLEKPFTVETLARKIKEALA